MATTKSLPSHSGPPQSNNKLASTAGPSPSPTLYLTNLPEKLRKQDLRTSLYMLFSTYGVVLDVNAMRGNKMRGQAHVVMRDVNSSTQAMRALQGFDFFGKEMKIQYSDNRKGRSHIFNKLEGEWKDANATEDTAEKKQSAFEAPRPGQQTEAEKSGPGLQSKPTQSEGESHGTKRPREEDEEEEQEASMDEDEDEDVEMEESDED